MELFERRRGGSRCRSFWCTPPHFVYSSQLTCNLASQCRKHWFINIFIFIYVQWSHFRGGKMWNRQLKLGTSVGLWQDAWQKGYPSKLLDVQGVIILTHKQRSERSPLSIGSKQIAVGRVSVPQVPRSHFGVCKSAVRYRTGQVKTDATSQCYSKELLLYK